MRGDSGGTMIGVERGTLIYCKEVNWTNMGAGRKDRMDEDRRVEREKSGCVEDVKGGFYIWSEGL